MKSLDASAGMSYENKATLVLVLLWGVLLWASFDGFYFYDDVYYVRKAVELLRGNWQLLHVMDHRVGLYAPVAFFIAWGGVHEWTVLAYPLICMAGVLVLLWRYCGRGWAAVLFLITDYYVFHFAAKLYPDTILMFWVLLVCIALDRRAGGLWAGIGAAVALFAAFLTKETIVWLLPALLVLFVQDRRRRLYLSFWRVFIIAGAILLGGYFVYYTWKFRHPLYRFLHIQAEHSPDYGAFSYYDKPWIYTLRRITYQPLLMFMGADMWTGIAGALVAVAAGWHGKRSLSVWSIAFLSMLGMFWFFTTSFRYYNPITLHARMALPLVPLAAAVIGYHFFALNKKSMRLWAALLWAASLWVSYQGNHALAAVYFLKGAVLWGGTFFRTVPYRAVLSVLIALSFIHPAYAAYKARTQGSYWDEKYLLHKYFSKAGQEICILTDNRLATGGDFYFAFRQEAPRLHDLLLVDSTALQNCRSVWLLQNKNAWAEFHLLGQDYQAAFDKDKWQEIECRGRVCLYRKRP